MKIDTNKNIIDFAKNIRKAILKMVFEAKASHIGGALSMVDILAVLYGQVMNIDPKRPDWQERDIFLLSKGHACTGLYATLALKGFFPLKDLDSYSKNDSPFLSHTSHKVPGVELSTGSLGHALSVGCGLALSFKRKFVSRKVYCLLSDGELDEGSNWEAILFASHHNLNNLIVVIDYNKIQSFGSVKDVLDLGSIRSKFESFGWNTLQVDGHNYEELISAFEKFKSEKHRPCVIIADTIKGKGVDFMENELLWHYKSPSEEQYNSAINQIDKI